MLLDFSRDELFAELSINRELEFSLDGISYFISGDETRDHYIWDETHQKYIFDGTLADLFAFEFPNGCSFNYNIDRFQFEYLL